MFTKAFKIQGESKVKGKDLEALILNLKKQFNPDSITKIFLENEQCIQQKLNGSKIIIYHLDEYPAFVDGTGNNEFIPSGTL